MTPPSSGTCDYRIDPETRLALVRVGGHVTGHDIARYARDLHADADWRPTYDAIWDERGIAVLDVTPEGLEEMVSAQVDEQTGKDVVVAARETHETLQSLYARLVRARGRPAVVCATLDEAVGAVGLDALPAALRW